MTQLKFKETAENENNSKDFKLIKKYINSETVALDIGACIGNFTKFLAENCKRVYAFEPDPDNFKRLSWNTRQFTNLENYNIAISDKDTDTNILYTCPDDVGMSRLYHSKWCLKGKRFYNIMSCRIDNLLTNVLKNEMKIDFVKIDVEGYEYFVIMGMKRMLKRDHPTILMEFHCPSMEEAGSNPEELYEFMTEEMGYKQPIICYNPKIKINSYADLDSICRYKPAVNLLFT